jgi:hypothetical protein
MVPSRVSPPTGDGRVLTQPGFGQPQPTPDPTKFSVQHASDAKAYATIDELNKEHKLAAMPFPAPRGVPEPRLSLAQVLGGNGSDALSEIQTAGQLVFHALGDCGSTVGPTSQNDVTDKMIADFTDATSEPGGSIGTPRFALLLGDVVYSFGEVRYYYDQFYEPYRDYPAPVLAAAGNHDGMVAPQTNVASLAAFLRNFCAEGFVVRPEAGGLSRTAQIQPGVFFTFEAPLARILVLYSNVLEDPGVISDPPHTDASQIAYLRAALARAKQDYASGAFKGALLFAHHHPIYTASRSRHGWSPDMGAQIEAECQRAGIWPHAVLAGHAHNYQRFTRTRSDGTEIPYLVCGNGGHGLQKLTRGTALRTPQVIQPASTGSKPADQVVFENYDDEDYGYLRVVVNPQQLRIEYHPASDGARSKTPDDFVTVDLQTRKLVHYTAPDLGAQKEAQATAKLAQANPLKTTTTPSKKSTAKKKTAAPAMSSKKATSARR